MNYSEKSLYLRRLKLKDLLNKYGEYEQVVFLESQNNWYWIVLTSIQSIFCDQLEWQCSMASYMCLLHVIETSLIEDAVHSSVCGDGPCGAGKVNVHTLLI